MSDTQKKILCMTVAATFVLLIFNIYLLVRTDLYPMAHYTTWEEVQKGVWADQSFDESDIEIEDFR